MDKLKKEIRYIWFWLIFFTFISCRSLDKPNIDILQKEYIYLYFNSYKGIYNAISDTINVWKRDSLAISKPYFLEKWNKLDSLIIFNSDSTRLFTNHLQRNCIIKESIFDNIQSVAGAKISGRWYFFFGPSIVIDRGSYQDSIYAPLTFDELSYLAHKNMQSALIRDGEGKVKSKDKWLDFINNYNDWGLPSHSTLEQLDSLIVFKNKDKYTRKIDKTELEEIKKEIAASEQPPEPPDTRNWFQKKFGRKKLFETKEWKEYIANKNKEK